MIEITRCLGPVQGTEEMPWKNRAVHGDPFLQTFSLVPWTNPPQRVNSFTRPALDRHSSRTRPGFAGPALQEPPRNLSSLILLGVRARGAGASATSTLRESNSPPFTPLRSAATKRRGQRTGLFAREGGGLHSRSPRVTPRKPYPTKTSSPGKT